MSRYGEDLGQLLLPKNFSINADFQNSGQKDLSASQKSLIPILETWSGELIQEMTCISLYRE